MDNDFVIKGVKIVDGVNGLFITIPNKKDQKGNYHDACFPITAKFRNESNKVVLCVYQEAKTMNVKGNRYFTKRCCIFLLAYWIISKFSYNVKSTLCFN
jgi:DNA-binding cell septation regulator SpoVG